MARKKYVPKEAQLGFSGVHESDLEATVKELENSGAKNIVVTEDDGEYEEAGPYYLIDYRR